MAGVKGRSGGARKGAGRKPKVQEQSLVEKLCVNDDLVLKRLEQAVKKGEGWAIKLWFQYRLGMPKQITEIQGQGGGPVSFKIDVVAGPVLPSNEDDIDHTVDPRG
ncbi:MAG: hypothetical protein AAFU67_02160 [Bacteroidota bacterium]